MTNLFLLFAPTFAVVLLVGIPALTLILLRRAGVRGPVLALAALPALCLILGGYVFQWLLQSDLLRNAPFDGLVYIAIAKNIAIGIGAISPLLILAVVKWPVLDNSRRQVETFK